MKPRIKPEARAIPPEIIRWARTTIMLCTAPVHAPASGTSTYNQGDHPIRLMM